MSERIPEILSRLTRQEADMVDLKKFVASSVDDIKNTVKSEVGDLKQEQIADLRQAIKDRDHQIRGLDARIVQLGESFDRRVREAENTIRDWNTGKSIFHWLVKAIIGAGGLLAGYFSAKHIG